MLIQEEQVVLWDRFCWRDLVFLTDFSKGGRGVGSGGALDFHASQYQVMLLELYLLSVENRYITGV